MKDQQPAHRDSTGWFKSTASVAGNDTCVEVRFGTAAVGVRDSKNPAGGAFWVRPDAWRSFIARAGRPV
ncbi:MAG TPA: DUF397 domain-containing protein [Actinophytocola sp.]|uniref:DUF397 domain-containing protein n=1 Tax=Actinophytocola sp. TaxID=1872138 RepID=UPI002DC057BC|nr:DUF397 domain-containing protein [Actinophytocola sp.]HEU5472819.1 DUF397 domain-containing protein [Actinophytocola sp.]